MNDFDFSSALTEWYHENKRDLPWRKTNDPYKIWVSEIMLQQTRVEAVKPYYERFLAALPNVTALASASDETLNRLWQGLGYYSRARNMKRAAAVCVEKYGGKLPQTKKELLSLPGIGEYTAGAISSFAYGLPLPAIDGNVMRVLSRYLLFEKPLPCPEAHELFSAFILENIPKDAPGAFNQALIELGATLCGPDRAARCGGCPLVQNCAAYRLGQTERLPLRLPPKERKTEERTPLILVWGDRAALEKRPEKGLLAGLWQPPTLEGFRGENEVRAYLEKRGAKISFLAPLPPAFHVFTHIRWEMRAYRAVLSSPGDFLFFNAEERSSLAVPSAFKAYTEEMRASSDPLPRDLS